MHLASAAKASARLSGRDEVTDDDVREIAPYVLRHRLIVEEGMKEDDILAKGSSSCRRRLAHSRKIAGSGSS